MRVKAKKCKGTSFALGHGCGKEVLSRKYGLCSGCYSNWLLTTPEGKEKMQSAILKATRPRIEAEANLDKAFKEKENRAKLQILLVNVKNVCHEYVRLRDKGKPCASCNELWKPDHQAGHFYKSELYSTLRFDERNIHGQCVGCNIYKDGAESAYRVGLINRYGKDYVDELDAIAQAERKGQHKWDREELEKLRTYYKQKIKQLQQ